MGKGEKSWRGMRAGVYVAVKSVKGWSLVLWLWLGRRGRCKWSPFAQLGLEFFCLVLGKNITIFLFSSIKIVVF